MGRKLSIVNFMVAVLFGGLFVAIGVFLLSFVQFGIQEADLENQGVYTFTAVDRDHKVHEERRRDNKQREIVVTRTHTYYLVYATDDCAFRFNEKVTEQEYDQFQLNKEQNLPQPTMERSVWRVRRSDYHRYESPDMTMTQLLEKIQNENRMGTLVAFGIIGLGVLIAVFIMLPRKGRHRVRHTRRRKGTYRVRYRDQ